MTGVAKNTVSKLLCDLGWECELHHNVVCKNLPCKNIQCDEIWSFCYAKRDNVPDDKRGEFGFGDVWTWTAIDADTKLVPSYMVGTRSAETANAFLLDLADRLASRVQLTTDSHKAYLRAVEGAFENDIDYALLVKLYGAAARHDDKRAELHSDRWPVRAERRYSPSKFLTTRKQPVCGNPDWSRISTSYVERQNLTMRMGMRRFTRLTNGFSKKVENLACAVALHFAHYNFCRPHQSLNVKNGPRVTPAMAAGVAGHAWTLEELVGLLEAKEARLAS